MKACEPLLTSVECELLTRARQAGTTLLDCSLDLGRSRARIDLEPLDWGCNGSRFPYPERWRERTIYHWTGAAFEPAARYGSSLAKLVPTEWGAPTFELDGVKMLPTARVSPYADAGRKVALIEPAGKTVLDTCAGLGYFAAWCLTGGAVRVLSFEKNADVLWLRGLNPWSPPAHPLLTLTHADVLEAVGGFADRSVDAVLHDPPRFGTAGDLYSERFYGELHRILKRGGRLFHYTGTPNKLTSGRDVPREVMRRLRERGFVAEREGDGVLAVRR